jgi:hypothetical protein
VWVNLEYILADQEGPSFRPELAGSTYLAAVRTQINCGVARTLHRKARSPRMTAHCAQPQHAGNSEPPSFKAFASRPLSEWHNAQDAWLAQVSDGKTTLPPAAESGSIESKTRAAAWRAAIKRHARAVLMSLAEAGNAAANAALDAEVSRSQQRRSAKAASYINGSAWHPRPRGSAPAGYTWDHGIGIWLDGDGRPRPNATHNQRRVQQRQASEVQSLRHKRKWALYDSCERRYRRRKGEMPALTAQEQKACNAGWRLSVLSPDLYAKMGYDAEADRALRDSAGDVMAAVRRREADARAAKQRERDERDAAYRAAAKREAEQLERARVAPERLAEGRRLTEGFVTGGRVEFRTWQTMNLKTGRDLKVADCHYSDWQPGTLTKVVSDGHIKCAYGVAWLEVRPDGKIPGYGLLNGESHVIPLSAKKRKSAGVYELVRQEPWWRLTLCVRCGKLRVK